MEQVAWHNLSWQEAVRKQGSDLKKGLSEKEVERRLKKEGKNELPRAKPLPKTRIFLAQFKSPLVYILLMAGIITLFLKEFTDTIVIFGAVFLNTIVGYFQENKASQALRKLKKALTYQARVIREGNKKVVDASFLVPGDIFILSPGDKIPADGRLIEVRGLKVNEMALTGEWLPVLKHSRTLGKETPLAERNNMVYRGTIVEDGKAKALVIATGAKTEIGKIAKMVRETKEEKTPLQKKLSRFAKIITLIISFMALGIFIEGMVRYNQVEFLERFKEMFTTAVAVAVAAIPEGLPVALTVILALGMQRILKRKGLVRKLVAAETLGSTSVICTDKTATLTEGKMKVSQVLTSGKILKKGLSKAKKEKQSKLLALKIATLANEAFIENPQEPLSSWVIRGRPTDRALLQAGVLAGLNKKEIEEKEPQIAQLSFNPENKFIAALHQAEKNFFLYLSGAPERVLGLCSKIELQGDQEKLSPARKEKIEKKLKKMAAKGLRVVAVAYRQIPTKEITADLSLPNPEKARAQNPELKTNNLEILCTDLVFVGLIALKDHLRKEVKEAIKICRQAGIRPILVTGDHQLTARAIGREIGLKIGKKNILEGKDLDKMSEEELAKKIKDIKIYARVEPRHKMKIISAWQDKKEVVAMTGDGINDAPALKKADIGVAVGSGTDVAKEVSDLILLTDSFNIIVAAVEEGRAIIDNIRKVIVYLFSDSFTEVILIGGSLLFGWPLPITAAQILWVNLIEDGPLGLSLAFEPKEKDLMKRKPEPRRTPLLTKEMKALIFVIGLVTDLLLLGLFFWLLKYSGYNNFHIRSIIFAGLTIDSIFYVFSCKNLHRNLWHINPFSNKFLSWSWLFSVITLVAAFYLPPLQVLLKTVPLNFFDWQLILGLGLLNLVLIEGTKWYFITRKQFT